MKINRTKPVHWLYLALFGANVALAMALRRFQRHKAQYCIVLYGHKLSGNLLAIYNHLRAACDSEMKVVFLTMDPVYHRELKKRGESSVLAITLGCSRLLASADFVISDHGLHVMQFMLGRTDLKFFDMWHGIPFKGFDAQDFCVQQRFDEIWLASPLLRTLYADRFGFREDKLHVTGYARTDRLVKQVEDPCDIRRNLGLTDLRVSKFVLFAPTWKQDARHREVFPFGLDEKEFLTALSDVCRRTDSALLVRKHLNSASSAAPELNNVIHLSYADFPDTEQILLISDVLVCDWSSIAFDFLLLDRPTIFLDVEAPFAKGFSLGPDFRYGAIVADMATFIARLEQYLTDSASYHRTFSTIHAEIKARVYGNWADGQASQRCCDRLQYWLAKGESSQ